MKQSADKSGGAMATDYLRVSVIGSDERSISVTPDGQSVDTILKVPYSQGPRDWSYLKSFVSKGTRLSLVRPRIADGVCTAELIVLEPDYLVDVTTVANCFEDYAHHPIVNLLNKFRPMETSRDILLGNMAGKLLDEEIHSPDNSCPTDRIYGEFLRENALAALTVDLKGLRQDAEEQRSNIRKAIQSLNPSDAVLEPSFFCEMLGLQGRMDLMQSDRRLLLEQKSGKGAFAKGQSPDDPPIHRVKHQVQLLLYRAILHYNYDMKDEDIRSYLLYSKYGNALVSPGTSEDLLQEAMRIRNGIVWYEEKMCREGSRILEGIKPDRLRMRPMSDNFWERWKLPELNMVFQPLADATPLELAYFRRFTRFLATEHALAKVGRTLPADGHLPAEVDGRLPAAGSPGRNNTEDGLPAGSEDRANAGGNGFASLWLDTPEEKLRSGNICLGLSLSIPESADGSAAVREIELRRTAAQFVDSSNFREGDIVIAYPYPAGGEPEAGKTMVFRCTVLENSPEGLLLGLRSVQGDRKLFQCFSDSLWAVEHDLYESSINTLYKGLFSFLSAPQERRDLILFRRTPEIDESATLMGDYGGFNELALRVRQARDLFLIIGPPGTGKTSFGMLYTVQEELVRLRSEGSPDSVLVTAYTNRAVDEICSKLIEAGIDFVRLGHTHSCDSSCTGYLLDRRLGEQPDLDAMRELISRTRVIVGTSAALNTNPALFRLKRFSLAVIDEASQILEPQIAGILAARCGDGPAIRKIVMIGDHKQLPAVTLQSVSEAAVDEAELNAIHLRDCRASLFERLLKRYRNDPSVTYMLTRQGRMHHEIAAFPNLHFYGGKLREVPLPHQTEDLAPIQLRGNDINGILDSRRMAFIAVEASEADCSDQVNMAEAGLIAETVVTIYRREKTAFDPAATVGVIVPYRCQIAAVRHLLDGYGIPELRGIAVDTVERFQGSQRDYIIYGFTVRDRSRLEFLSANVFEDEGVLVDRKLNVVMTRARSHLLLFGDPAILSENPVFSALMEYAREKKSYFNKLKI